MYAMCSCPEGKALPFWRRQNELKHISTSRLYTCGGFSVSAVSTGRKAAVREREIFSLVSGGATTNAVMHSFKGFFWATLPQSTRVAACLLLCGDFCSPPSPPSQPSSSIGCASSSSTQTCTATHIPPVSTRYFRINSLTHSASQPIPPLCQLLWYPSVFLYIYIYTCILQPDTKLHRVEGREWWYIVMTR